jgi:hypothetical protein
MSDEQVEDSSPGIRSLAKADFESALRKGFWRSVVSWLTQNTNELLPFDEVRKNLPFKGQHYIGLRQIPINDVVGSVGRYNDFDRAFLPRYESSSGRWISIDEAHLRDIDLPAIEVYKIGSAYFVKDGNHRVSVARERGQFYIDAEVTEIETPALIDASLSIDDLIRKKEQAEFFVQTHLNELHPEEHLELTVPGGYDKLLEHIHTHQWFEGEQLKHPVPLEEAARSWYADVYLPLVNVIRQNEILKQFPNRTEADLYLWIIEHLYYLREEVRQEVSLEEAASHFAKEYSEQPLQRIINIFRRVARNLHESLGDVPDFGVPPVISEKSDQEQNLSNRPGEKDS